jgi:hypothetical protein
MAHRLVDRCISKPGKAVSPSREDSTGAQDAPGFRVERRPIEPVQRLTHGDEID